jgi:hypothetical protein
MPNATGFLRQKELVEESIGYLGPCLHVLGPLPPNSVLSFIGQGESEIHPLKVLL